MPNTFPSTGPVGIGTNSPDIDKLLTMDTGGATAIALARIRGRSPAWIFGQNSLPYTGGEAFVGLVTDPADYINGGAVGDAFFIHGSNLNRVFVGRTANSVPVMAVHNASANVAIGLGATTPPGRLVVAVPYSTSTASIQLHGQSAGTGARTLALGYAGPYNGQGFDEAAFVQCDWQGQGYYPIHIQPLGGVVAIGKYADFGLPDLISPTTRSIHRFFVNQKVTDVADSSKHHIMATFDMESKIPHGDPKNDIGAGRFTIKQVDGGAWMRALEAQAVRYPSPTTNARTWGLEVGCHNALRAPEAHVAVGIYVHGGLGSWWTGNDSTKARRANTGILIEGDSSDGEGAWDQFILCRRGRLGDTPAPTPMFYVDRHGNVWGNGSLEVKGDIRNVIGGGLDISGDILSHGTIAAFQTVQAGGEMYATQFVVTSSQTLKENIVPLDPLEADSLLTKLAPVRYNLKARPDRTLIGFVAEDVGAPFAVETKGVDIMAVVSTLAAVVKSQREALSRLKARVDSLQGGAVP